MDDNPSDATFQTRWVHRGPYRIHVRDHPGPGPAVVLLHGFPDDLHLYDSVMPHVLGARRVIAFDFLGWGASDKPHSYPYTAHNQTGDLDAVITQLELDAVVLVAHDASGPPAIDWAIANPERVAALVLLNTYYALTPRLRRPPAIALYSTPGVRVLARAVARRFDRLDRALYHWQVGRFITDAAMRRELLPAFYTRFRAARPAFWRLNADLLGTVVSRRRQLGRLRQFPAPVRIVFGTDDRYLNIDVARWFDRQFPHSDLHLLPGARHYVQVDRPREVSELVLSAHHPATHREVTG